MGSLRHSSRPRTDARPLLAPPQVARPFAVGFANAMATAAYLARQRQLPKPRMVAQMMGIVPGLDKGWGPCCACVWSCAALRCAVLHRAASRCDSGCAVLRSVPLCSAPGFCSAPGCDVPGGERPGAASSAPHTLSFWTFGTRGAVPVVPRKAAPPWSSATPGPTFPHPSHLCHPCSATKAYTDKGGVPEYALDAVLARMEEEHEATGDGSFAQVCCARPSARAGAGTAGLHARLKARLLAAALAPAVLRCGAARGAAGMRSRVGQGRVEASSQARWAAAPPSSAR